MITATRQPFCRLIAAGAALAAIFLTYSQTAAFAWDEGFHLLAAQLIKSGKRPYIDFCFPQTPLNAYWNAAWMRVFGESWHTAHAIAAVATIAAILLAGDFLLARFPNCGWRLGAAITAALSVGLNATVLYFGTIGQAYGLCLFLIVAAFRLSIAAVDRRDLLPPGLAGLLAAAAAASSLLTAPIAPVLLVWMLIHNRTGARVAKCSAFLVGSVISYIPLLWLFAQSPRQVFFSVVQYNLHYRQAGWPRAIRHDLEVLASAVYSPQALLLGLLTVGGLLFVAFRSQWDRARKTEFYLCGWLAAALGVQICCAHPFFPQYFILLVPFVSILAAGGLYSVAPERPLLPILAYTFLLSLGLAKSLYEERDDFTWQDFEQVARKVDQVTPPGAPLLADEHVYFLTRRTPPSGMELRDSHKLEIPADLAATMHIVNGSELDRQITAGVYSTVETCTFSDEKIAALGLTRLYSHKAEIGDCMVFWNRTK